MIEIFHRIEEKYLLTESQYQSFIRESVKQIKPDLYFESAIDNIYFDTITDDFIHNSLEKPLYKEKIRLRSYKTPKKQDKVYLEIKKKYKGIVSKRRIKASFCEIEEYLNNGTYPNCNRQIMKEIDYYFKKYHLIPKRYVGYDRNSYVGINDNQLRITIDTKLRSRTTNLNLDYGREGELYFNDKTYIMEIKTLDALPLWLVQILNKNKIYATSFSKYGMIYQKIKEENYA